jgi:hypothetical protein
MFIDKVVPMAATAGMEEMSSSRLTKEPQLLPILDTKENTKPVMDRMEDRIKGRVKRERIL